MAERAKKKKLRSRLAETLRWMFDLTLFRYTPYGIIVTSGMTIAAVLVIDMPVFLLIVTPLVFISLSYFAGGFFRPRVRLSGHLPDKVVAGREFSLRYQVTNLSRLPMWDFALGIFGLTGGVRQTNLNEIVLRLGGGQTTDYAIRLKAGRRGIYRLREPACFTVFPFNLVRMYRGRADRLPTQPLVVQPDYYPIERLYVISQARHQAGGVMQASRVGESPEYVGNREYRQGDSPRRIDPRAWARLAVPVVKEYNEEYFSHLALILDTHIPAIRQTLNGWYPQLEAAVSLTAAVVDSISRGEDIIDVFATGPDLYVFRAGRHLSHIDKVLEILAGVQPCYKDPFEQVAPRLAEEIHKTSAVIFVFLDWDVSREKIVRFAAEAGCTVRIVIIRDKPPTHPYHAAENWAGPVLLYSPAEVMAGAVRGL